MKAPFGPSRRLEAAYERGIGKILARFTPRKDEDQTIEDWLQELAFLSARREIDEMARALAAEMVQWANIDNARSWREASARSQRSRRFYRLAQAELVGTPMGDRYDEIIRENATLITSIPQHVANRLNHHLARAQQRGMRYESQIGLIRAWFPRLTRWKVKLIGRTETAKAAATLTQVKSERLGILAYEWDTSRDSRVRRSHHRMQGVIVFWKDPPSPEALVGIRSTLGHYHPGNCPNCRCGPLPLMSLDDVTWPHEVYFAGSIHRMTRARFANLSGIPARFAAARA